MTRQEQMIIVALGDKVDAIKAQMSQVDGDTFEWRHLNYELGEYEALLQSYASQAVKAA